MKLMADILGSLYLWKLKKTLYGFMDAVKHFLVTCEREFGRQNLRDVTG